MLEQLLDHLHNYFEYEIREGKYAISDGKLDVDFLLDGQYFKVEGSVFNNGVHKYPDDVLIDESFEGKIWLMAVPPAVIGLAAEISDWLAKYSSAVSSPYQSESFGGYSYSKGSGSGAAGKGLNPGSWQGVFRDRLNHWRKIA